MFASETSDRYSSFKRDTQSGFSRQDDILAQNLTMLLDHEIKKDQRSKTTEKALKLKKIYYKVYFLKYVALYIYMFMVFFEVPTWCLNKTNIKDKVY